MRIDIITVLPEMIEGFVHESILARAQTISTTCAITHSTNGAVSTTIPTAALRVW